MQKTPTNDGFITLDEAVSSHTTTARPVKTFVGFNTGNRTFTFNLTLTDINEFTDIPYDPENPEQNSQRKLVPAHAQAIAKYVLKGLLNAYKRKLENTATPIPSALDVIEKNLGTQVYLSIPPLVATYKNCQPNGTNIRLLPLSAQDGDIASYKIYLSPGDTLWIIDGQHRRKAIQLVAEFLEHIATYRRYPSKSSLYPASSKIEMAAEDLNIWIGCKEMLKMFTVSVEVHLGLNKLQERQLFHDLNNLARKVEKSLALQYDQSNPVNTFIQEVLIDDLFIDGNLSIHEKEKSTWNEEDYGFTRKDLVGINAILFLNKTNINGATPGVIEDKREVAENFWKQIVKIDQLNEKDSKKKIVAIQPVVIKALAKLFYDFNFGKNTDWATSENQEKLLNGILTLDYSHDNPMWRYYELDENQRIEFGLSELSEYLPDNNEGQIRSMGSFDSNENVFKFGERHNDIIPLIGDMVRWKLNLPTRKKITQPVLN